MLDDTKNNVRYKVCYKIQSMLFKFKKYVIRYKVCYKIQSMLFKFISFHLQDKS